MRCTKANSSNSGKISSQRKLCSLHQKRKKLMDKNKKAQVACERNGGKEERAARSEQKFKQLKKLIKLLEQPNS